MQKRALREKQGEQRGWAGTTKEAKSQGVEGRAEIRMSQAQVLRENIHQDDKIVRRPEPRIGFEARRRERRGPGMSTLDTEKGLTSQRRFPRS